MQHKHKISVITLKGVPVTIKLSKIVEELSTKYGVRTLLGIIRVMEDDLNNSRDVHLLLLSARETERLNRANRVFIENTVVMVRHYSLKFSTIVIGESEPQLKIPQSVRMSGVRGAKIKEMSNYLSNFLQRIEKSFPDEKHLKGITFIFDKRTSKIRNFAYLLFDDEESARNIISHSWHKWSRKYDLSFSIQLPFIYNRYNEYIINSLKIDGRVWLSPNVWKLNQIIRNQN